MFESVLEVLWHRHDISGSVDLSLWRPESGTLRQFHPRMLIDISKEFKGGNATFSPPC